jgi:hypothetical protein
VNDVSHVGLQPAQADGLTSPVDASGDPHMMGLDATEDETCLYRATRRFGSNEVNGQRDGGEARGDEGAGGRSLLWDTVLFVGTGC